MRTAVLLRRARFLFYSISGLTRPRRFLCTVVGGVCYSRGGRRWQFLVEYHRILYPTVLISHQFHRLSSIALGYVARHLQLNSAVHSNITPRLLKLF